MPSLRYGTHDLSSQTKPACHPNSPAHRLTRSAIGRALLLLLLGILPAFAGTETTDLDAVLDKAGNQVASYAERMANVRCTEQVTQQELAANGHADHVVNSTFDYFIVVRGDRDTFLLNESRLEVKPPSKAKVNVPLLLTNGFSTLFMIFHPYYRGSFRFDQEAREMLAGSAFLRVRFSHIAGTRTPAVLALHGREYPLPLTGTAWIDPESGVIARIEAGLQGDMSDIGVRSLSSQVEYSPVSLPGWNGTYRFPAVATVDVVTLQRHWHNVHNFSDYHRFGVDTKISLIDEGSNQ